MKTEKRILNPTAVNLFISLFVCCGNLTSGQHFSSLPLVVTFYNQQGILAAYSASGTEAITYHFRTS